MSVYDRRSTYGPTLADIMEDEEYKVQVDKALDSYPIYDESFRPVLNQRIVDHFWLREIGQDTPRLFSFYLGRKLREVMPQINVVFSTLATKDVLSTADLDIKDNRQGTTTDKGMSANDTTQDTKSHTGTTTVSDGTRQDNGKQSVSGENSTESVTDSDSKTSSRGLNSNNPNNTMRSQYTSDYYNSGAFADGNGEDHSKTTSKGTTGDDTVSSATSTTHDKTVSDSDSTGHSDAATHVASENHGTSLEDYISHKYGRDGVLLPEALKAYYDGYNNGFTLVFQELEPCFTQYVTDHYNGY